METKPLREKTLTSPVSTAPGGFNVRSMLEEMLMNAICVMYLFWLGVNGGGSSFCWLVLLSSNRLRLGESISNCGKVEGSTLFILLVHKIFGIVDDSDDKRAARTPSYIFTVLKFLSGNLKTVAAWTGVKVETLVFIVLKVLFGVQG